MKLSPSVTQRQPITDPRAYWTARIGDAVAVWSPTLGREAYVSPREHAFLVWLRADAWRVTTNRAVASMFGVSPGTVARWCRTLVSLGLVSHLSRAGGAGWTRLRRDARTFVMRMHAPQRRIQEDAPTSTSEALIERRTVVRALRELVGEMPWMRT